jgi:site-specific DNA-cytosine methylase
MTAAHTALTTRSSMQETELLAAGFPCVDVSRQGLRQGMMGKVRRLILAGVHSCDCH